MGNGSIFNRKDRFDESIQYPSIPSTKRCSTASLLSTPVVHHLTRNKTPMPVIKEGFEVKRNTEQYTSIWDNHVRVSAYVNYKVSELRSSI